MALMSICHRYNFLLNLQMTLICRSLGMFGSGKGMRRFQKGSPPSADRLSSYLIAKQSKCIHCFTRGREGGKGVGELPRNIVLRWKWVCSGKRLRNRLCSWRYTTNLSAVQLNGPWPHRTNSWWLNKIKIGGQESEAARTKGNEASKWERTVSAKVMGDD